MDSKICEWPTCDRERGARKLCSMHLYRKRMGLDMEAPPRAYKKRDDLTEENDDDTISTDIDFKKLDRIRKRRELEAAVRKRADFKVAKYIYGGSK